MTKERRGGVLVLIVPKPDDWQPSSPHDLPPEFERVFEDDEVSAEAFVRGFNSSEMVESKGWWAIA